MKHVVEERQRPLIHPLQIVDDDQNRACGNHGSMGGLEDSKRIAILGVGGAEGQSIQRRAFAGCLREMTKQVAHGRERH